MNLLILFARRPRYILFSLLAAAGVFTFITLLSQVSLVVDVAGQASLSEVWTVLTALVYGAAVAGTAEAALLLAVAFLFGVAIAGTAYYLRVYHAAAVSSVVALSAGGTASGLLALGCLSCGSLLVALLSSFFSASSILIVSAYQSLFFGVVSIVLLLAALALLDRHLEEAVRYKV